MLVEIKACIEKALPGSIVEVLDPQDDGKHLKAVVAWDGFRGLGLLEQHRKVNEAIAHLIEIGKVHALSIETKEKNNG